MDLFDEAFQRQLQALSLVARRVASGAMRAERRSKKIGAGTSFADYRTYAPGDDFRRIDWNAYGRLGRLLLRLYEEEEDLSVYILLDTSRSMALGAPPKLDYARQLAAALAYISLVRLDRVHLMAASAEVQVSLRGQRGRQRLLSIFGFLRGLHARGTTDLRAATAKLMAGHKRRGLAILITDLYDPRGFEAGIDELRLRKLETHVIELTCAEDDAPELHGDLELVDAETGQTRAATVTPALLRRYRAEYAARSLRIASYCANKHVGHVRLDTRTPLKDALLQMLRRGALLS